MGEVTESMLDGTLCCICGACLVEEEDLDENRVFTPPGYPRKCKSCKKESKLFHCCSPGCLGYPYAASDARHPCGAKRGE